MNAQDKVDAETVLRLAEDAMERLALRSEGREMTADERDSYAFYSRRLDAAREQLAIIAAGF